MNRKIIWGVGVLALGLFVPATARAQAQFPSDAVQIAGMNVPLVILESDPSQFRPAFFGPVPVANGAVVLYQDAALTIPSDQIFVQANHFYFASDPNLVDLGPNGFNIPINKKLAENGLVQDVSQYFFDVTGKPLPDGTVLVSSDPDVSTVPEVPEPASLTLLAIGGLGLAGYGWRRRKTASA